MTEQRPPPREMPDKDAEGAMGAADPAKPLDRFKALARRLVNVPRPEFEREEKRYNAANAARRQNESAN